jgi:hypothetical protein
VLKRYLLTVAVLCVPAIGSEAPSSQTEKPKQVAASGDATSEVRELVVTAYDKANAGALQVKGETRDWFITQQNGKQVGPTVPPVLNSVIELPPGSYDVFVNKTKRKIKIEAGQKTVLTTGTLVLKGRGNYYAPYEGKEARFVGAQPRVNSPIGLFAGTYTVIVQVGVTSEKLPQAAKVVAGKTTTLTR